MEAVDIYYSSISDCRWFPGNRNVNEIPGFTWSINSSLLKADAADWQISLSDLAAGYTNMYGSVPVLSKPKDGTPGNALVRAGRHPL